MSFTTQQQKGIKKLHKSLHIKEKVVKGDPIVEFVRGIFKRNPFVGCAMKKMMPRFRPTAIYCRNNCRFKQCPKKKITP